MTITFWYLTQNMTCRVSPTFSKSVGQQFVEFAVPSFPEGVEIQDFLPNLSSTCVVTLWKISAIPLKSLIPAQGVADSKQTQVVHMGGRLLSRK